MKTEFLVIVSNDDCFCCNENALINFLKSDTLLTIKNTKVKKIVFKKPDAKNTIITANLTIISNTVSSNKERYFLITLENNANQEANIDLFSELSDRVKNTLNRLSSEKSEKVIINTLWDDVGRYYAEKSYPIINEVENLMRKLITMFLTINVGINWIEQTIHTDLLKETEKVDDSDNNLNDLYKLDFIKLTNVLFDKTRAIKIEDLDRLLQKTDFNKKDQKEIKKFIPMSNWEKYFIDHINTKDNDLKSKWEILYKLRNKVAHNRYINKQDYLKIYGICRDIISIINEALTNIDNIKLKKEEKELIQESSYDYLKLALEYAMLESRKRLEEQNINLNKLMEINRERNILAHQTILRLNEKINKPK